MVRKLKKVTLPETAGQGFRQGLGESTSTKQRTSILNKSTTTTSSDGDGGGGGTTGGGGGSPAPSRRNTHGTEAERRKNNEEQNKINPDGPMCAWRWKNCQPCIDHAKATNQPDCSPETPCGGPWGKECDPDHPSHKKDDGVIEAKVIDGDSEDYLVDAKNKSISRYMKNYKWPRPFMSTLTGMTEDFKAKSEAAFKATHEARQDASPESHMRAYQAHKEAMADAPMGNLKDFSMHAQQAALHYRKAKGE